MHREALLSFQSEALTVPLLLLPNPLDSEALAMFRKLQCVMGDRFSLGHGYIAELIKTAEACAALRDELYVQLLKQLRGNTSSRSVVKGYKFLSLLCDRCPPSSALERYVREALEMHVAGYRFSRFEDAIKPLPGVYGGAPHAGMGLGATGSLDQTELGTICAEALRTLEVKGAAAHNVETQQRRPRKSVFEFQVRVKLLDPAPIICRTMFTRLVSSTVYCISFFCCSSVNVVFFCTCVDFSPSSRFVCWQLYQIPLLEARVCIVAFCTPC